MSSKNKLKVQKKAVIIDVLRKLPDEAQINAVLSNKYSELSGPAKLALKSELKRLAQSCRRILDFRNHLVNSIPYEYDNKTHYIDATAVELFKQQLERYPGGYTQGLYEAINKDFLSRVDQLPDNLRTGVVAARRTEWIIFSDYYGRSEERLHWIFQLDIEAGKHCFSAKVINISEEGLKIRLDGRGEFRPTGSRITAVLSGITAQYPEIIDRAEYQIVHKNTDKQGHTAGLKRLGKASENFSLFLQGYIRGHKKKFGLSTGNLYRAIKALVLEQIMVFNSHSLPVFLDYSSGQYRPRFVLTTPSNRHGYRYWRNESGFCQLGNALTDQRIKAMLLHPARESLLYVFIHRQNGKDHYCSATTAELNEKDLRNLFVGYAAQKKQLTVFSCTISKVDLSDAELPECIPATAAEAQTPKSRGLSRHIQDKLSTIHYMLLLREVSDRHGMVNFAPMPDHRRDVNELACFKQNRIYESPIEEVYYSFSGDRQEPREIFQTVIEVRFKDDVRYGVTIDISPGGLQIALDDPLSLPPAELRREMTEINLQQLQSWSAAYDLTRLPYRVMGVDTSGRFLNLKAVGDRHQGKQFFADEEILARFNRGGKTVPTLIGGAYILRNLWVKSHHTVPLYLSADQILYAGRAKARSALADLLTRIDNDEQGLALRTLGKSMELQIMFKRAGLSSHQRETTEDFIFYQKKGDEQAGVNFMALTILPDNQARKDKIRSLSEEAHVWLIRLKLCKPSRPDDYVYLNELNYLQHYGKGHYNRLKQEINGIKRFAELDDVTALLMLNLGFSADEINRLGAMDYFCN